MLKSLKLIAFLLILFKCYSLSFAQLNPSNSNPCAGENVGFTSPDINASYFYEWDFCGGDFLETPTAGVLSADIPNTTRPEGMDMVTDGTNWYGFITNRVSNNIVRVSFGNSLDNAPTYTNLGNVSSLLNAPIGIKIIKDGLNWYGIVVNFGANALVRVDLGNNLSNNSPTAINLGSMNGALNASNRPVHLDVVYDNSNGNYYAAIANSNTNLVIVNFGNTITNTTFDGTNVVSTGNLPESNTLNALRSITLMKDGTNWYGIAIANGGGAATGTLTHIAFGSNLFNGTPTFTNLMTNLGNIPETQDAKIIKDGDSYIAFVVTNVSGSGGNIHRLNFGSSLSNTNPTNTNLGNFGIIGQRAAADPASLSIEITKDNSKSYVWVVNRFVSAVPVNGLYNQLIKLEFPNVCNADISGSSSATPTNNFYIGGNYNITLNIYRNDNRSLVNSYGQTLTVKNATVGNFTVSGQCLGETTNFNNTSAGSESNVSSWLWDFGDGTTSTAKNPTKQYTNTGVYSVKLTVNNVGGCTNTITKNITIRNYPNATFSKIGGCVNEGVRFINESANNTNIINRVWTFSDGSTFFASPVTDLDTTKFFNSVGEYEVMLTVTNDAGCVSTSTMKINIGNKPVADFNFSNACERVPIQFSDVSQAQSIGESIVAWQWNFGISGANSTLKNPTYTYNNVGNYTVSLTAFSSTGCSAQVTKLISLKSSLTSSFSTNDTLGLPPFTAKFNNQNTNAVSYVWDFGNGVKSTDASPSYTYTSAGDYVVKYQALNLNGCGTIVSKTIKVLSVTDLDVNTTALPAIRTYPNPATERLFLQNTTSELFQLRIFNTQGVLIHSIILDAKDTQMIDVNNWSSGVYMIVAEQKGIVSSYRVMVHQ